MSPAAPKKPLLVVITESEYSALSRAFLSDSRELIGNINVEHGTLGGRPVAVCRFLEMGSKGPQSIAFKLPDVLSKLSPSFVMELGICFGLKADFSIGEIGVCQNTIDYEYQKVNDGDVQFRTRSQQSDATLYSKLILHASTTSTDIKVKGVNYACGDKVINSEKKKGEIRDAVPDAACGDMESFPLATVCSNAKIPWIVVKASSDDGVNKGDSHQHIAANNSVNFVESFLSSAPDIDIYFPATYDVDLQDAQDFSSISKEIFGQEPEVKFISSSKREIVEAHIHPILREGWIIVFISKAHSIPAAIRSTAKLYPPHSTTRVDICIASTNISAQNIDSYASLLEKQGYSQLSVATADNFIYEKIVKNKTFGTPSLGNINYIDQNLYRDGVEFLSGRAYARTFLSATDSRRRELKPVSVILGQGGIGKTTFCRNLVQHINSSAEYSRRVLLVTKNDVMRKYSGEPIDSITDLYREYVRGLDTSGGNITSRGFEVAMSCGSIVLMVDGIDEIESALGERFNMAAFTASISKLNKALESCKVILTSRDTGSAKFTGISNADIIHLNGFSDSDVTKYLGKDYLSNPKLKSIVNKIKNRDGFVNPYLLHVAQQHLTNDSEDDEDDDIQSSELSMDDPFDYILARSIQREIIKQSLNIEIDEYFLLLCEIVVEHENSIIRGDFDDYIEIIVNEPRAITKHTTFNERYLKFFLLEQTNDRISLTHPEYVSNILINRTFKALLCHPTPNNSSSVIDKVFGNKGNEAYSVREQLVKKIINSKIESNYTINRIKEELSTLMINYSAPRNKKCIYEMHLLAFEIERASTQQEHRDVLVRIHGPSSIKNLVVLGKFPRIDYSSLSIVRSIFIDHGDFLKGTFNKETRFRNCVFHNCSSKFNLENADKSMFDDCELDEGMRDVLNSGGEKSAATRNRAKVDARQILKSMRNGLGFQPLSFNRIKSHSSLSSAHSYEEFLAIMVDHSILDVSNNIYTVKREAEIDATALCEEDHSQGFIKKLLKKFST